MFTRYPKRRRGFSLVELLVMIGIAVMLFALFFTSFHRYKQQALSAGCQNNLREIFNSWSTLRADNDGYLRPLELGPMPNRRSPNPWRSYVADYHGGPLPSCTVPHRTTGSGSGYGVHAQLISFFRNPEWMIHHGQWRGPELTWDRMVLLVDNYSPTQLSISQLDSTLFAFGEQSHVDGLSLNFLMLNGNVRTLSREPREVVPHVLHAWPVSRNGREGQPYVLMVNHHERYDYFEGGDDDD